MDAWLNNNWAIHRGAEFASVLSDRNLIAPWPLPTDSEEARRWWVMAEDRGWRLELSGDWGSIAPAVFFVVARLETFCPGNGRSWRNTQGRIST